MNSLRTLDAIGTIAYVAGIQFLPEKFAFAYGEMRSYNGQYLEKKDKFIYYDRVMSSWLPRARNDLVKQMRGDWILMLDSDMTFDPDIAERMLFIMDKYQAPVLTGLYVQKKPPYFPVLYSWNEEKQVYQIVLSWQKDAEIIPVDAAGAGCLLVRKFVFNLIWEKLHEDPFTIIGNNSEDMSFFSRLRKIGIGVYCAPNIRCSHLSTKEIDYDLSLFPGIHTTSYYR